MNISDEIERLSKLRDSGALTEEEFVQAKGKVLVHREPLIAAPVAVAPQWSGGSRIFFGVLFLMLPRASGGQITSDVHHARRRHPASTRSAQRADVAHISRRGGAAPSIEQAGNSDRRHEITEKTGIRGLSRSLPHVHSLQAHA